MLNQIFALNITQNLLNQTQGQQITSISQEPYFITGHVLMLSIPLLIWFIIGFLRVFEGSKKVAFQTWIYWAGVAIFGLILLGYFFIFIYPIPIMFIP